MLKRILSSFGKNHWESYAISIGAEYTNGGILHSDQIFISKPFYKIHINLGTNQRGNAGFLYTRFRCAYTSSHPLYFKIKKRSFFSKLWNNSNNHFSIQNDYSITHNSIENMNLLLSDASFVKHLRSLSNFKFTSEKDDGLYGPIFPSTEHQLSIEVLEEIKSPIEFNNVITLLDYTLELLLKNGLLSVEPATVNYKKG